MRRSTEKETTFVVDAASGAAAVSPAGIVAVPGITLALAHGLTDAYASFIHPLLPRIMDRLGLSIALATTLSITMSLAASLTQPAMGHLADRYGRRALVVLGPLCTGLFLSLMGLAPSFGVLLIVLTLGGLGSAAFHPAAASMASSVRNGRGSGVRYSMFSFGGSVGYAIGPLVAVSIVGAFGIEKLWLAMIPMLLFIVPLSRLIPADEAARHASASVRFTEIIPLLRGPLGLLFGISAASTFVQRTFITLEPIAVNAEGGSEALGALVISVYFAGEVVGTLVGGALADRMDRRKLMMTVAMFGLPAHALAIVLPIGSFAALACAAAAGFSYMAIYPSIVVSAQEILPRGAAVSSGIVMGLAWGVGALGVFASGAVGDVVGARSAALYATPGLLIAVACAAHPSLSRWRRGDESPG